MRQHWLFCFYLKGKVDTAIGFILANLTFNTEQSWRYGCERIVCPSISLYHIGVKDKQQRRYVLQAILVRGNCPNGYFLNATLNLQIKTTNRLGYEYVKSTIGSLNALYQFKKCSLTHPEYWYFSLFVCPSYWVSQIER
jgi:hypothetical protein